MYVGVCVDGASVARSSATSKVSQMVVQVSFHMIWHRHHGVVRSALCSLAPPFVGGRWRLWVGGSSSRLKAPPVPTYVASSLILFFSSRLFTLMAFLSPSAHPPHAAHLWRPAFRTLRGNALRSTPGWLCGGCYWWALVGVLVLAAGGDTAVLGFCRCTTCAA